MATERLRKEYEWKKKKRDESVIDEGEEENTKVWRNGHEKLLFLFEKTQQKV